MINEEMEKWRYAIVLFRGLGFEIMEKYPNIEQLETGYRDWKEFALEKNITRPIPIELCKDGNIRILDDIAYGHDVILN